MGRGVAKKIFFKKAIVGKRKKKEMGKKVGKRSGEKRCSLKMGK